MKKKKWLCLILCCGLLLSMLAACGSDTGDGEEPPPVVQDTPAPTPAPPPPVYVLDFADGKTGFLSMNVGAPMTDAESVLEVGSLDGSSVLKLTAPNGGNLRLGINVDGLLGNRAADIRTVVFDVYADYPDGNFSAVSGKVTAMSGDTVPFSETSWQIYLASRNPVQVAFEIGEDGFSAAGPNLIEFACTTNGPATRGETPAVIIIKSISFFDASNTAISINTGAGWSAPEGYGEFVLLGGWLLTDHPNHGDPGTWQMWHTPGVDGNEDEHMPWQVVAASFGIVFEIEEKPESFSFVYHGGFSWDWKQFDDLGDYWEDGKITIMWDDIGFDPNWVTENETAVKFYMGNWNAVPVGLIYLLYDEDAMP